MVGLGFEPCYSGWESATLLITLESRLYCNAVQLHLIPISTILLAINYVIILCIYVIMSWNRIENNAVFIFLRRQTESRSKTIAKKKNMLHNFCFQELQDGTGMDKARSAWKLFHIKVGLSLFLWMDLFLILHYYSCTATTLLSFSKHRGRIEWWQPSWICWSDQEDGYLKEMCTRSLTAKRWQNIVPYSFPNFNKQIVEFMQ